MKESSNSLRIYAQERFPEKSQIPTEKKIEISLDRILQDPGPGSKGSGFLSSCPRPSDQGMFPVKIQTSPKNISFVCEN